MQIKNIRGEVLLEVEGDTLRGANLEGADLRRAYLRRADLEGANLEGANLGSAYLGDANLRRADLRGADLEGAYLGRADLSGADLGGAYLGRTSLEGANLSDTGVFGFTLGKHAGFAHFGEQYSEGNHVKIGCEGGSLDYWLKNHKEIGKQNGYSPEQIERYGRFLALLKGEVNG